MNDVAIMVISVGSDTREVRMVRMRKITGKEIRTRELSLVSEE